MKSKLLVLSFLYSLAFSVLAQDMTVINPTRDFGYTIGDIIEQTLITTNEESTISRTDLPELQRVGAWLSRHSIEANDNDTLVTIRYQLINSPVQTRVISLPALNVLSHREDQDQPILTDVPAWSFSISPLVPSLAAGNQASLPLMQADQRMTAAPLDNRLRTIKWLSLALLTALLLWLSWWLFRVYRETKTLPFAQAHRSIQKLKKSDDASSTQHWLSLHRAFDQAAGQTIGKDSVTVLIQEKSWLKPYEQDINAFYRHSRARFFAPDSATSQLDVASLARKLFKAEKKHTRKLPIPTDSVSLDT